MFFHTSHNGAIRITTGCFKKETDNGSWTESNSVLSVTDPCLPFNAQAEQVLLGIDSVAFQYGNPVFIRFFLSDPANQAEYVKDHLKCNCPVSVIGQAPLDGSKIAAWVWCRSNATVKKIRDGLHSVSWLGTEEMWYSSGLSGASDSFAQTVELLDDLSSALQAHGMTLQDDCARTWLFVQNIDVNYKGVVDGRNSVFDRHGLTCDTHFIASTGIEERTLNHANKVMLDAVAVKGIGVEQQYLYGASHLNRTSEYGVRFERGTVVRYPDFKHVFISGTASIDNKGQVIYPGDIVRQTGRMIENVEVLLAESGCSFNDVPAITVYLRDPSDYAVVKQILAERFPEHPLIVTLAPVCRPGWLIEMECVAISC